MTKEIQRTVRKRNTRAVWRRLRDQKTHIEKQKAFATVTEKFACARKINSELLPGTYRKFFKTETPEERTIIPGDIWKCAKQIPQNA